MPYNPHTVKKIALHLAAWLITSISLSAADSLNWDTTRNRVDAQVESWTVPQLLERVAAVTGWQVFLDPTISNTIPTKFRDKNAGDALQRLLGSLNYALAPETNGASRLYVFRNSRAEATLAVAPIAAAKESKGRIGNEVVVTLKPGEKIEDLAKRLGAKIIGRADAQNTYRLRFDDDNAAETARDTLRNDPSVSEVDDNFHVSRPEIAQALGVGARPLGLNPAAVPDGKYIVIGLIDTAVQTKGGQISEFLLPGISVAGESNPNSTTPTHGTSMAETILRGLAFANENPNTILRILPVDVYGQNATTSTFDVAAGIAEAVKNGATIINLSLGSEGDSSFLRNTVMNVTKQNVTVLAAAGNSPVTTPTYPAAYPEVIAVTAGDRQGNIAPYANRGSFVDVIAPGTSLVSFGGQQYYVTGTSTSTAYASGQAGATAEKAKATSSK